VYSCALYIKKQNAPANESYLTYKVHVCVCMCCLGWAKSKDVEQLSTSQRGPFLTALFKALKLERPLLISASMSGSYVVPYIMSPEPQSCRERVSAFVPLAPVGTERFTHAQYHRCEV